MYKIGIVGFGVVGKSALAFLRSSQQEMGEHAPDEHDDFLKMINVSVWDSRTITSDELALVERYGATLVDSTTVDLKTFIEKCDYILPSPGVSLQDYLMYSDKFLCELDFFSSFFQWPVIAVTGSAGKTTTTKLIAKLANMGVFRPISSIAPLSPKEKINAVFGGNIGIGMLDLIKEQHTYDLAVLELSSFQLELSRKFAPDIALWTNVYPNHLDRHNTLEEYCEAKGNLLRYQNAHQMAVLSKELFENKTCKTFLDTLLSTLESRIILYSASDYDQQMVNSIKKDQFHVMFVCDGSVWITTVQNQQARGREKIIDLNVLPEGTFLQNWVAAFAALYFSGIDFVALQEVIKAMGAEQFFGDQHYRVEHFATIQGVDFFDDSKATLIEATQMAVERLAQSKRPLIVILGGLSKGAKRTTLMNYLSSKGLIKKVYCFGPECTDFPGSCVCNTLEDIVASIGKEMQSGDQVLFSPSGTSFDFFKDYKHRGTVFKELVSVLRDAA